MSYRPDQRTHRDLVEETRANAIGKTVPALEPRADGSRPDWSAVLADDPLSLSLIDEVLFGASGLLDHLAQRPQAAAHYWLHDVCGITPLPAAPAQAVVGAQVAERAGPVVVPAGTALKGPKNAAGTTTAFETVDTLVATGATVLGVGAYGRTLNQDTSSRRLADDDLFDPFAAPSPATHELVICSDALRFSDGQLVAEIDFGSDVSALLDLNWEYSGPEGDLPAGVPTPVGTTKLQLTLDAGSCAPRPTGGGVHCYLKASFPVGEFSDAATAFSFDQITVKVHSRDNVIPEGAFYNDGVVDISKEFKPFGDVPKRGDSFYVRSEEALSKKLSKLTVYLDPLNSDEYSAYQGVLMFGGTYWQSVQAEYGGPALSTEASEGVPIAVTAEEEADAAGDSFRIEDLGLLASILALVPSANPTIEWETLSENRWASKKSRSALTTTSIDFAATSPTSDKTTIGGVPGWYIRAFLSAGDFGWDKYLEDLATFATKVADPAQTGTMPTAPKPPMLASIRLSYTTVAVGADLVESVSGLSRTDLTDGGSPFAHPVVADVGGVPAAAVYVGVEFPDRSLGQTFSVYFDVDASAACSGSTAEPNAVWEFWNGAGWTPMAVADATTSLRTSGLLRFVAPLEWPTGCTETDTKDGRWFRLATNRPDMVGTVCAVIPDAVSAAVLGEVELDAPAADTVKGPTSRIAGIDKMVNPIVGRAAKAPETEEAYVRRAPQVIRTRNRVVQPVDYEMEVRALFPEVAFVACLPHQSGSSGITPGQVAVIVIPDSADPAPLPSADLVVRVETALQKQAPIHAKVSVICPSYQTVSITATIVLAKEAQAVTARAGISSAVDAYLHPLSRTSDALGRPVYRSELISLLESLDEVDRVSTFSLGGTEIVEKVEPPSHVGMVVSSGAHDLELVEQLT